MYGFAPRDSNETLRIGGFRYSEFSGPIRQGDLLANRGTGIAGLSDEKMLKIVYSASLYPFSGFFVTSPATHETVQFTPKDLEQIARNIVGIAVGAFDEGSFLVWWREAVRQFPLSFEAGC